MSVELFKHNQHAYERALELLETVGRAAVIHPTGTGKSFIAFKLCSDHPDVRICWLSPSEYIFRTQVENWQEAGGEILENIQFFTYAKLMLMSQEEIEEIQPDYIVLDEFHRCGAKMWGLGVERLLEFYSGQTGYETSDVALELEDTEQNMKQNSVDMGCLERRKRNVPVLGLSATNIRYLDNQRDMADELFEGNIASQMSLGEAIVRGILNPPKYVLSAYSYQKDLEKLQKRVRTAKSKAVRDKGEQYLEALRRTLENADGLDKVFFKHMEDRTGKYIVFCANVEHLYEMKKLVPDWFYKVDEHPHVYTAYADDPETSQAFAEFKADCSEHLKLLFCVDMLNEGIHVEDVSGVILLRPTVSPTIYKQQIGRALSANKKKKAVIFDIVLNIENLYSIDEIQEEMQIAMTYYYSNGMSQAVVNERFEVKDMLGDCMELFDRLQETLTASWDLMYEQAQKYHREHGNLEVTKRYVTADGHTLGMWLNTQRRVYAGKIEGNLTEARIEKLDALGMRWEGVRDLEWQKYYEAAQKYFQEYGDLLVSAAKESYSEVKLGRWIAQLRMHRKNGSRGNFLTAERIEMLDKIGMVWDVSDYLWERNYEAAVRYYRREGNLEVPFYYIDEQGVRLGTWVSTMRKAKMEREDKLVLETDSVGIDQNVSEINSAEVTQLAFEEINPVEIMKVVSEEINSAKNTQVVSRPENRDGKSEKNKMREKSLLLGNAESDHADEQEKSAVKCRISQEQIQRLDAIGMVWESRHDTAWNNAYEAACRYKQEYGNLDIPVAYISKEGCRLGKWIRHQRDSYKSGLSAERIAKLNAIGMVWEQPDAWNEKFRMVWLYYEKHGNANISSDYVEDGVWIGRWLGEQVARMNGKSFGKDRRVQMLSDVQIEKLESVGIRKNVSRGDVAWEMMYQEAKAYYEVHGDLVMPKSYCGKNGKNLSAWLTRQRDKRKKGMLESERCERLERIGMVWERRVMTG